MIKLILGNKEQGKKKNWVKNILMEETKFSYSFSLKKKVSYSMWDSKWDQVTQACWIEFVLSTYLPLLSATVIKQDLMPAALNHSKSKWDRERERERYGCTLKHSIWYQTNLCKMPRSLTFCRLKCKIENGVTLK